MAGPGAYYYGDAEKKEVLEVLEYGYLSRYGSGDDKAFKSKVLKLEKLFAEKMGSMYGAAVNSGTNALYASLIALGVGRGDEVLVPGYTFIATYSAVIAVGALPVFVEIDESLTIDPIDIKRKITPKTKAIIPVHMIGNPCKMDKIMEIARANSLYVLEDVCQALGGSFKGQRLGSIGDLGAFSLNIYKVINAGDGGILVTDNEEFYERAFGFHDQGHKPHRSGVEIGTRNLVGLNFRMNELTGAFALGQLSKLDDILATLREKKNMFKNLIMQADIKNMYFREINDIEECATLLTVLFKTKELAEEVAAALGSKTMDKSGWHVYNNMENILSFSREHNIAGNEKHALKQTDDILGRAVNMSVGVVDSGIGADFGININSTEVEIEETAARYCNIVKSITSRY